MLAVRFYDVVLWAHISAVLVAFGVIFAYPVMVAFVQRQPIAERAAFHRMQGEVGQKVISSGILATIVFGAYLASDAGLWGEPWVVVPLVIAVALGALGGLFFKPKEERLAETATAGDEAGYAKALRSWKLGQYSGMVLVLVAVYFMTAKPFA